MSKSNDNNPTATNWRRYHRRRRLGSAEDPATTTLDAPHEDTTQDVATLDDTEAQTGPGPAGGGSEPPDEPKPLRDIIKDGQEFGCDSALAARVLNEWYYDGQSARQDAPSVTAYRAEMATPHWWGGRHLGFGRLPDGDTRMVDGYKRLFALQGLPGREVIFTPKFYDVADAAQLHRLWQSFEPGIARTLRQELRASGKAAAFGLHSRLAESLLACIPYIASEFRSPTFAQPHLAFKHAARERYAEDLWPLLARYQDAITPASARLRVMLIAGGFLAPAIFVAQHGDAELMLRFVSDLAAQTHVNPNHPTRILGFFAIDKTRQVAAGKNLKLDRRRVLTKAWAQTWNEYVSGAERMAPLSLRPGPISLLGTPLVTTSIISHRRRKREGEASLPAGVDRGAAPLAPRRPRGRPPGVRNRRSDGGGKSR